MILRSSGRSGKRCCILRGSGEKNPAFYAAGFGLATFMAEGPPEKVLLCHEPLSLSEAALAGRWRFMGKLFSEHGFEDSNS